MPQTRTRSLAPGARRAAARLLPFAVAAAACFWRLGAYDLTEPDEGRYASVARMMLDTGNWLEPRFQARPHFSKPPLAYWLIAASLRLFGRHEAAARAPSAAAAAATLLLTAAIGRRFYGPGAGEAAALLLASAPLFFVLGRIADPNMLLTACVALAIWGFVGWQAEPRARYRVAFYAGHALALVTKGPVGNLIILLALAGPLCAARRDKTRPRILHVPSLLLALGAGLAWYAIIIAKQPALARRFLLEELGARIYSTRFHPPRPFWFFLSVLAAGWLPWLAFLASGLRKFWASRREQSAALVLAWAFLPLAFFSLLPTKLIPYVLPLFPAFALAAAGALAAQEQVTQSVRGWIGLATLMAVVLPPAVWFFGRMTSPGSLAPPTRALVWLACALVFAAVAFRGTVSQRLATTAAALVSAYLSVLEVAAAWQPPAKAFRSARALADALSHAVAEAPAPVVLLHAPSGLEFYLEAAVIPWLTSQRPADAASPGYFVMRRKQRARETAGWAGPWREIFDDGRHIILARSIRAMGPSGSSSSATAAGGPAPRPERASGGRGQRTCDGLEHLLDSKRLLDKAGDAEGLDPFNHLIVEVSRHHDDRHSRLELARLHDHFNPVHGGHAQVHQH